MYYIRIFIENDNRHDSTCQYNGSILTEIWWHCDPATIALNQSDLLCGWKHFPDIFGRLRLHVVILYSYHATDQVNMTGAHEISKQWQTIAWFQFFRSSNAKPTIPRAHGRTRNTNTLYIGHVYVSRSAGKTRSLEPAVLQHEAVATDIIALWVKHVYNYKIIYIYTYSTYYHSHGILLHHILLQALTYHYTFCCIQCRVYIENHSISIEISYVYILMNPN